jgi:hypothetical protein
MFLYVLALEMELAIFNPQLHKTKMLLLFHDQVDYCRGATTDNGRAGQGGMV